MHRLYFFVLASILAAVVIGCNGSDDVTTPDPDPVGAAERVNQADDILYPRLALIFNSQGRDTSAFNVSTANALYREALTLDANNTPAHFGVAVTSVIALLADPSFRSLSATTNLMVPVPSLEKNRRDITSRIPNNLQTFGNDTRDRIDRLACSALKPGFPLNLFGKFGLADTARPPSHYQDLIETKFLPVLTEAVQHLTRVTMDPYFAFYVTPRQLGGNISDSIRIDLTEVYVLLAVLQSLVADGSMAVAYNVDYDPTSAGTVMDAWEINSPFLAFRPNGARRMRDTRSNFVGVANSIRSGILYLKNETPHPGIDPITYRPEDDQQLMQIYAMMDTVEFILSGNYQVYGDFDGDGSDEILTINLYNAFENAIGNFKQKLPGYTVSAQAGGNGKYDAILTWTASSFTTWIFPDPTFNGYLPGMTDMSLKAMFGMTAFDWTPYIRIEG